jgi:NADPH:quinone reductase-like Zn-dependent oxidoreductase
VAGSEPSIFRYSFDLNRDFRFGSPIPTPASYGGDFEDFMRTPLNQLAQQIAAGKLKMQIGKTSHLDEIVEAHRVMEENTAGGRIVVVTQSLR